MVPADCDWSLRREKQRQLQQPRRTDQDLSTISSSRNISCSSSSSSFSRGSRKGSSNNSNISNGNSSSNGSNRSIISPPSSARAIRITAVIMLALHARLSAAFLATKATITSTATTTTTTASLTSTAAFCFGARGSITAVHRRGLRSAISIGSSSSSSWKSSSSSRGSGTGVGRGCARPCLGCYSTASSSAMTESAARQEVEGGEGGADNHRRISGSSSRLSNEERAIARAERREKRQKAREARVANVGRAKSVRRAGSPTAEAGLEALRPPPGPPGSGAPALSGLPDMTKPFTVLGIETSCDDTAAAVVRSDGTVLGEAIAGQAEVHEKWGGVVPGLARDSHALKMDGVVEKALAEAGLSSAADVDAIAVTVGPGLEICLRVGCEKAKALAAEHDKPFVAVHHLEAHALLARKAFPPAAGTSAASDAAVVVAADDEGAGAGAGGGVGAGGDAAAAAAAAVAPSSSGDTSATATLAAAPVAAVTTTTATAAATAASSPPSSLSSSSSESSTPDNDGSPTGSTKPTPSSSSSPSSPPPPPLPTPKPLEFPFLGLLVSGGHCQLLLCKGVGSYRVLGGTVDDALGEAYDKAARLLGLKVGGGGGPAVEALALKGDPTAVPLSVPMQARKDLDFSFAGLKNSFRLAVSKAVDDDEEQQRRNSLNESGWRKGLKEGRGEEEEGLSPSTSMENRGAALPFSTRADLAASFQHTAIRHLEERVRRAMDTCDDMSPTPLDGLADAFIDGEQGTAGVADTEPKEAEMGRVQSLAVVGGVAANQELRRRLQVLCEAREPAWQMVVPPARLCTDNGVMVAWAAVERLNKGMSNDAEGQAVYARLPLGGIE